MSETPGGAAGESLPPRRKRVIIVDDSESWNELWAAFLTDRYRDRVNVETYLHPLQAMSRLGPDVDLLLCDLEMPMIDGRKFVEYAATRGVRRNRIIVASGRDAELLHELFPTGDCLAVINKTEPRQQEAFLMILDGVMRR